jgi:hypothetical protein
VLVTLAGLYSGHAYGNWAAVGVPSAVVVTTAVLVRGNWWRAISTGILIGLVVQVVLVVGGTIADRVTITPLGKAADLYGPLLGWKAFSERVGELAASNGAASVAIDRRDEIATLAYYRRSDPRPLFILPSHPRPANHYEWTASLSTSTPEPILFMAACTDATQLRRDYASVADLGSIAIAMGPTSSRRYQVFLLSGVRGPVAPLLFPCEK